jgi:hypothetical protein
LIERSFCSVREACGREADRSRLRLLKSVGAQAAERQLGRHLEAYDDGAELHLVLARKEPLAEATVCVHVAAISGARLTRL